MPDFRRLVVALLAAAIALGAVPVHPQALEEPLQKYVAARVAEFDTIPAERRQVLRRLSRFIDDRLREHQPARLTFICTHNSRRSQLAQVWGATAAAYYGVTQVDTFSGGTQTMAFNSRAIAALRRAGLVINRPQLTQNPRYDVRYRRNGPSLECFSKLYFSAPNPHSEFCAVMTCAQADKQCPVVTGAALRISLPYDDPKEFDNAPQEALGYDERCRQIARELLFVFSNVQP